MSTTMYQTTAKPRGRRDFDPVDPQPLSRTSSNASQRLTKTSSRPLEDSSSQVKSRSHSPALFWQRNKTADLTEPRDSITNPPKGSSTMGESPEKPTGTAQENVGWARRDSERLQSSMPPPAAAFFSKAKGPDQPGFRRSHSRSRTRSLTQSMIARMQPTVADASEDEAKSPGARSSATSLELNSANTSDIGEKLSNKASAISAAPQSHEAIGEPLKAFYSTPNVASATTTSPPQRPVDYQTQYATYGYPAVPGSFPSPLQRGVDTPTQNRHLVAGYSSPHQRPTDSRGQAPQDLTPTPTISPPLSPRLVHQQPMYSSPPVPYHYGYPPQVGHGQGMATGYYPAVDPQYMPSPPMTQPDGARTSSESNQDEHQRDWHKITGVLPELNRILAHYQDQKGQASSKDSFAKQLDFQRTQEMARIRVELEANKEEYEKVIQRLVSESFQYKRDIKERDEKINKMQAMIDDLKIQQEEFRDVKTKYEESTAQLEKARNEHGLLSSKHDQTSSELQSLNKTCEALQKKHDEVVADVQYHRNKCQEATAAADQARLAKEDLVSVKMRLEENLEDMRRRHHGREEKHQSDLKVLRKEHDAALDAKDKEKHNAAMEHKGIVAGLSAELTGLMERHTRCKKELEAARTSTASAEKKLEDRTRDMEAQATHYRQQIDAKSRDMEAQASQYKQRLEAKSKEMGEQATSHRQQLETQLASLTSQRHRELDTLRDEQAQALRRLHQDQEAEVSRVAEENAKQMQKVHTELDSQKDIFDQYKKETDDLRAGHGELAATLVAWNQRQQEWQAEQNKLSKVLESLGLTVATSTKEEA